MKVNNFVSGVALGTVITTVSSFAMAADINRGGGQVFSGDTFVNDQVDILYSEGDINTNFVTPIGHYNWSGFKVGIFGAYTLGKGKQTFVDTSNTNENDFSPKGFGVGGAVSYDMQEGAFVYGLKANGIYSTAKEEIDITPAGSTGETKLKLEDDIAINGLVRLGYAVDKILIYGLAGASWQNQKLTGYTKNASGTTTSTNEGSGSGISWAAGAGLAVAFNENISGNVEVLYSPLKTKFEIETKDGSGNSLGKNEIEVENSNINLFFGVDYHFGPVR